MILLETDFKVQQTFVPWPQLRKFYEFNDILVIQIIRKAEAGSIESDNSVSNYIVPTWRYFLNYATIMPPN